jgi:hypothetical protein
MATWSLRRFSCPETLRRIHPKHLREFLEPYRSYLASRGIVLPAAGTNIEIDAHRLAKVFLSPDSRTPAQLVDALCLVEEMSTPAGMDVLLQEAEAKGLEFEAGCDQTPGDVAIQVWLLRKDFLERKHAERYVWKVRSFEHFHASITPDLTFKRPREAQLALLANDLDEWFDKKKRGRGSRVIMGGGDDAIWFLVRHPEPYRREETLEGSQSSSVCFRPIKYDVVVFTPQIGELRINARSNGEKQLYRTMFGKFLLNDDKAFAGAEKYTLAPLRESGADCLACFDVEGIDWVKLREAQFFQAGSPWEVITRKSDDLFGLFESRDQVFPESGRLVQASFQIKFSDSRTPRTIVIKPSNVALFTRDDDSILVEKWLEARGFILGSGTVESEQPEETLASH